MKKGPSTGINPPPALEIAEREPLPMVMMEGSEISIFRQQMVAMNEALILGSVRQHELTEAAETLNSQLLVEITERKQAQDTVRVSEIRYRISLKRRMTAFFCSTPALAKSPTPIRS